MQQDPVLITLEHKKIWENSKYFHFLSQCNQEEFLASQIPFYYAVEAFPRMLIKLTSQIETSHERLLVIENLWEEHGMGDPNKFHTATFKKHLESLGLSSDDELFKNPFITEWISKILDGRYPTAHLGSMLAGIEYIYAVISNDIAKYMDTLDLKSRPTHYSKHSELDWSHGLELIDTVKRCGLEFDVKSFKTAQIEFINLFEKMIVPTEKWLTEVSQEPVAFYYSRENSGIELWALSEIEKESVDIFTVCSGGEHILNYISESDKKLNITVFDVNEKQIDVFKNKLSGQEDSNKIGKFEHLFKFMREWMTENTYISTPYDILNEKEKLNYITHVVFSRRNLNIVFTENATKYSSSDFAKHFYHAFVASLTMGSPNAMNIFFDTAILRDTDYSKFDNYTNQYVTSNLLEYKFDASYDLIDLSNVGDWMDLDKYKEILASAYQHLNSGGKLIARKLLGDYSLEELLMTHSSKIQKIKDTTYFYSECVVLTKDSQE